MEDAENSLELFTEAASAPEDEIKGLEDDGEITVYAVYELLEDLFKTKWNKGRGRRSSFGLHHPFLRI